MRTGGDTTASTWAAAVTRADALGLLREGTESTAAAMDDKEVHVVATLVDAVRNFVTHPGSRDDAYVPLAPGPDGRWLSARTLEDHEIEILRLVAACDLDRQMRLRVLDLLANATAGRERVEAFARVIAVVEAEYAGHPLDYDALFAFGRAFAIAPRFGPITMAPGDALEKALLTRLLSSADPNEVLKLAQHLREHRRSRPDATSVAAHLRALAVPLVDATMSRLLREEAASWALVAGDKASYYDDLAAAIHLLQSQAINLLNDHARDSAMRAGADLELALDRLKLIPRAERSARGLNTAHNELTRMIRRAGSATLAFMKPLRREVPIPEGMPKLAELIEGCDFGTAAQLFLTWLPITNIAATTTNARELAKRFPLTHLFPHFQVTRDGRTVARSSSDENDLLFGLPSNIWRTLTREFGFRVGFYVQHFLAKAWLTLTAEHHLSLADFTFLARESPLVPSGREALVGRGLHYGYGGDFLTAAHLLIPQLENIVRAKLLDAGISTSTIEDGIEMEKGLSALMKGNEVEAIFGQDTVFEIRALFCSPHGPNLRNEVAHGLLDDDHINSATAFYAWWFIWRLVHTAFFNSQRDAASSDSDGPVLDDEEGLAADTYS